MDEVPGDAPRRQDKYRMKVAIISDLHSNLEALQACLAKAAALDVTQYVCLGDMVGYGPDPAATLDTVMALPGVVVIRGNHEEALFGSYYRGLRSHVRQSIDWTKQQLKQSHLDYVQSLPYQQTVLGMTMVHATADQPERWAYLHSMELASRCMQAAATAVTFIGHTHQPLAFVKAPDKAMICITPINEQTLLLEPQNRYVINVGSVGQPRDEINKASFVIYDTFTNSVVFHRVAYDYEKTAAKIRERGLPELFAERLKLGR